MASFRDDQRTKNRESQAAWESFANHRAAVDRLLRRGGPTDSLVLFGAGNCNDLQLDRLTEDFSNIALVDCDREAMEAGLEAQSVPNPRRFRLIESDITGAFETVEQMTLPLDGRQLLETLTLAQPPRPAPSRYSRSASLCLLSQLMDQLQSYLDSSDADFVACAEAIRRVHLRTLLQWTKPGGEALMIWDLVSSDTAPELLSLDETRLPAFLKQCLQAGNFFTGLHPGVMMNELQTHAELAPLVETVQMETPWLWDLGRRRFAVCCLRLRAR